MTATEELRALLDGRGVEWNEGKSIPDYTLWMGADGREYDAALTFGNNLLVGGLTPQQAIAATLGRGECEDVSKTFSRWTCSECGRSISVALTDELPRFCCGCGRAVKR